jgi:hypothetical protein
MKKSGLLLLLVVTLLLPGCGGGGSASAPAGATPADTVAGKVTLNGAGLGQVTLTIAGVGTESSDGSGSYSFGQLANGTYTITPARAGYTFSPASQSVTVSGNGAVANFSAAAIPTYKIAGTVSAAGNGAGLAGATVSVAAASTGAVSGSQVTDGSGHYTIAGLLDGNYVVTVSHSDGYSFTPASSAVTVSGADASADFSAAGVATYTVSGKVANASGAGLANVSLTLSIPSTGASYHTVSDGSGNYSLSGIPNDLYTLTPTLAGYDFVPNPVLIRVNGADSAGNAISAAPSSSGGGSINITL